MLVDVCHDVHCSMWQGIQISCNLWSPISPANHSETQFCHVEMILLVYMWLSVFTTLTSTHNSPPAPGNNGGERILGDTPKPPARGFAPCTPALTSLTA